MRTYQKLAHGCSGGAVTVELKIQVCLSQDIQELLYLHVQLQYTAELHPKSGARPDFAHHILLRRSILRPILQGAHPLKILARIEKKCVGTHISVMKTEARHLTRFSFSRNRNPFFLWFANSCRHAIEKTKDARLHFERIGCITLL